ncbi:superoxide dismutase family protein [Oceanisphaera pacifica]|uniref:Superoxide dismutase [Cu-Zn] n=1 Tax=Oceanisphaera pacifica TaxID=2818389 RepID=A0ABS3NGF0_9GAMM|nr:superoxide dismutase family protein [Oceanisphaera pacifica]MBO1519671.1 superoxide dismutase family protein [Oceanisphaera pacifica]
MKHALLTTTILAATISGSAFAKNVDIDVHQVDEQGTTLELGTIAVSETDYGLLFTPQLSGLTPGLHGFHVHQHPDCGPKTKDNGQVVPAGAAGGHFDPTDTGQHLGPYDVNGHLGDLPALYVDNEGHAKTPVLAPKLTAITEIQGHAIMLHANGDNFSDTPKPLGGGGARMACGIIN